MTTPSTFSPLLIDGRTPARRVRAVDAAALIARGVQILTRPTALVRHRLRIWNMRLDDRAYLADLREFQLSEMGMTHGQRFSEVRKPFWEE